MPPEEYKNNILPGTKEAVETQLDSFMNPDKPKSEIIDASSYYSQTETKPKTKSNAGIYTPAGQTTKVQNKPIVRTYKSDLEETVQTGHISSINMAVAENKRMFGVLKNTVVENTKNKFNKSILIISILLIIGGILTFLIPKLLIQINYSGGTTPVETFASKPVMTVDVEEKINIRDINLLNITTSLKEKVDQSQTKLGQIRNIFLTEGDNLEEKLITSKKFLDLIRSSVPDEIQRTLKDPYMFGSHNYNGNQRFVILKVGSYDTTFSGMLKWEPNLWQDFKELFDLPKDTSQSSESFLVEVKKFQDATYDNKDCRVVKDSSGKIVFLYSIIDEGTIVITTSKDTLREIVGRISKARVITQ